MRYRHNWLLNFLKLYSIFKQKPIVQPFQRKIVISWFQKLKKSVELNFTDFLLNSLCIEEKFQSIQWVVLRLMDRSGKEFLSESKYNKHILFIAWTFTNCSTNNNYSYLSASKGVYFQDQVYNQLLMSENIGFLGL